MLPASMAEGAASILEGERMPQMQIMPPQTPRHAE